MLRIAPDAPEQEIVVFERPKSARELAREEKAKRVSSLAAKAKGGLVLRALPWPQFLVELRRRRDMTERGHIRWCMRTALRNCESLKRAGGRSFELRPGGRRNIVSTGSAWFESGRWSEPQPIQADEAKLILGHGRYLIELDENLRKLGCPDFAVRVVRRAVRAKLRLGWGLENWNLDEPVEVA